MAEDSRKRRAPSLPDAAEREAIGKDLGRNILVEAAAGTGKTTSMVARMVELVAAGACSIHEIAAVTFTRKAASELRARFRAALAAAAAPGSAGEGRPPGERERLARALSRIEGAFIGTIHSFCGRLIRERPVEAGVDPGFREIDEDEDADLRREAWDLFLAERIAAGDPLVRRLLDLGLPLPELFQGFSQFAGYPDVERWPLPPDSPPDPGPAAKRLAAYAAEMEAAAKSLGDPGNDKLIAAYSRIPRMAGQNDLSDPAELFEILEAFKTFKKGDIVQKKWPGGLKGRAGLDALEKWNAFAAEVAEPFRKAFLGARYAAVIRAYIAAKETCDRLRRERKVLDFQDLLMGAAALLRGNPHVRAALSRKYTRLLVDEFQDTDPIQAEVILLLASRDLEETDWRRCVPKPGSLFVVGDPKQSIYRFRRADIVTYNEVKEIIEKSGGRVVTLRTNFRAAPHLVHWVNAAFGGVFPARATRHAPSYVPLEPGPGARDLRGGNPFAGVRALRVPETARAKEEIREWEADLIARIIRRAVDEGIPVGVGAGGEAIPASFGDFLVITYKKEGLALYGRALSKLGIPHQVTGGAVLKDVEEIGLLSLAVQAALRPDDPVALTALLRSALAGLSDEELYRFKKAGGRFSFRSALPEGLPGPLRDRLAGIFGRLKGYAGWFLRFPPSAALEKVAGDLGLFARAARGGEGNASAGGLAKAIELLRFAEPASWSAAGLARALARIASGEEVSEGLPARPAEEAAVRVMNLHQAKGLEAPVVFLADPYGASEGSVEIHVERGGKGTVGYLAVLHKKESPRGATRILARHPDWDEAEEEERRFLEAERNRLLYVAATRAGTSLHVIVSNGYRGNSRRNPWAFFEPLLAGAPEAEDPGPREAPAAASPHEVDPAAVEREEKALAGRWKSARTPTYRVVLGKEERGSPGGGPRGAGAFPGKDGTAAEGAGGEASDREPGPIGSSSPAEADPAARGTVIHALLETAMAAPGADLEPPALSLLEEHGLERESAGEILFLVSRVMDSALWRRARAAKRRLVEVPLQVPLPGVGKEPAVLKAAIDLVFEEEEGWVIVDYKTDRTAGRDLRALAAKYAGQLANYETAWKLSGCGEVAEKGIYFVDAGAYVPVLSNPGGGGREKRTKAQQ